MQSQTGTVNWVGKPSSQHKDWTFTQKNKVQSHTWNLCIEIHNLSYQLHLQSDLSTQTRACNPNCWQHKDQNLYSPLEQYTQSLVLSAISLRQMSTHLSLPDNFTDSSACSAWWSDSKSPTPTVDNTKARITPWEQMHTKSNRECSECNFSQPDSVHTHPHPSLPASWILQWENTSAIKDSNYQSAMTPIQAHVSIRGLRAFAPLPSSQ